MTMDHLTSLEILGSGFGMPSRSPAEIRDFAQRRVDHLRGKVEAGAIDAQSLQERLKSRLGEAAGNIVSAGGVIDFERLRDVITAHQASTLQQRLEGWFGHDARGIVDPDGKVDRVKFGALSASRNIERLQARLVERFGKRADGLVNDDGSIDIHAVRELFATSPDEKPYEPAVDQQGSDLTATTSPRFLYIQTWGLSKQD
jgi:hypothetical protein